MEARGFCTCKRDAPDRPHLHPPAGARWHYLCDKPVFTSALSTFSRHCRTCGFAHTQYDEACPRWAPEPPAIVPTGTGWPVKA